jgi:hypothetical protein
LNTCISICRIFDLIDPETAERISWAEGYKAFAEVLASQGSGFLWMNPVGKEIYLDIRKVRQI